MVTRMHVLLLLVSTFIRSVIVSVVVSSTRTTVGAFTPTRIRTTTQHSNNNSNNNNCCFRSTQQLRTKYTGGVENEEEEEENGREEWREFRARLHRDESRGSDPTVKVANRSSSSSSSRNTRTTTTTTTETSSSSRNRYAHECTPLVEVGSILVSIPTTDLCQALEQHYWHRAVVLVTDIAPDVARGTTMEGTVPDEQLAQGTHRGRWSYRGVLLNRCTDLRVATAAAASRSRSSTNRSRVPDGTTGNWYPLHRGGDLLFGTDPASEDEKSEVICLHHLGWTDPRVRTVSTRLVGQLSYTSLTEAQRLCDDSLNDTTNATKYHPADFFTYSGFCSWRPGQLELEMGDGRAEWRVLSVDDHSIVEEIQHQVHAAAKTVRTKSREPTIIARKLLGHGTTMWRNFLARIQLSEATATERLPAGQLDFYDRMLEVWSDHNLVFDGASNASEVIRADSSHWIGPGTLLRGTVSTDMLMYEQEFIRSLILVLDDTDDATIGIMLNHPLKGAVECVKGKRPLPLRYGGPIDMPSWKDGREAEEDEDAWDDALENNEMYEGFVDYQNGIETDFLTMDDIDANAVDADEDDNGDVDDSLFIWIHRDVALGARGQDNGGGTRLGTSDVWLIHENDAVESLQSGLLSLQDVMVFSGVCIWEKGHDLGICGGGMREQVDALHSFEIVQAFDDGDSSTGFDTSDHEAIENVWDILSNYQTILEKESLAGNIDAAIAAWDSCNAAVDSRCTMTSQRRSITTNRNAGLSDAALKAWVGVNLLMDPLGTLVEVEDN